MRQFPWAGLIATAILALSSQGTAQSIAGNAEAVDGDTLNLTGTRIRLFGIDAPESQQGCVRGSEIWACGTEARTMLASLIDGRQVNCEAMDRDDYGRVVAVCRVGGIDLAEALVAGGFATAYTYFSTDYVPAESRAKELKLGIWGSQFSVPADWRAAHPDLLPKPPVAEQAARPVRAQVYRDDQGGCTIKGNKSRYGDRIYHLPGQAYYDQTRAEDYFCTEADAMRAGYRRSNV